SIPSSRGDGERGISFRKRNTFHEKTDISAVSRPGGGVYMRRPSQVLTVAFLVSMLVVALAAGAALAQDTYVDVVINGQLLAGGGLIYGDRAYVDLRDVARVLGGRFVYDAQLNVAFIQTGRYEA